MFFKINIKGFLDQTFWYYFFKICSKQTFWVYLLASEINQIPRFWAKHSGKIEHEIIHQTGDFSISD